MDRTSRNVDRHDPSASVDAHRAALYALLGALLLAPPSPAFVDVVGGLHAGDGHDGSPIAKALRELSALAQALGARAIADEFDALFVSAGRPQVDPYGSLHLAGFMMEKPLAALRADLRTLGLARREGTPETEDHLGALCEAMRVLIEGAGDAPPRPLATQRRFFEAHLEGWYSDALDDIREAKGSAFYAAVADLAQAFLDLEVQAFATLDQGTDDGSGALPPTSYRQEIRPGHRRWIGRPPSDVIPAGDRS